MVNSNYFDYEIHGIKYDSINDIYTPVFSSSKITIINGENKVEVDLNRLFAKHKQFIKLSLVEEEVSINRQLSLKAKFKIVALSGNNFIESNKNLKILQKIQSFKPDLTIERHYWVALFKLKLINQAIRLYMLLLKTFR